HGFPTEMVAPGELDARIDHWIGVFDRTSRDAVAATKAMLNERFGSLLDEAMARETYHCVRLFDEPDARAALAGFAERRRGWVGRRSRGWAGRSRRHRPAAARRQRRV